MGRFTRMLLGSLILVACGAAQEAGTIKGNVTTQAGGAPGVLVTITNAEGSLNEFLLTDEAGDFHLADVPQGRYALEFSATGLETHVESDVTIQAGEVVELDIYMNSPMNIMEVLTVTSASRRPERVVEAPAAVSVITSQELERNTSHGQLPRLLENQPGVEITQSGVYDFNVNARGFNSTLNRRILVLIDGRDPATGFLGNQEWSTLSYPLEEFSSMELVRGPGSALYGANAFNGVLNIKTKRPADSPGGSVTLSGGELNSYRADARYAGEFGAGWSFRVTGGTYASETWSESRSAADLPFEYGPLPNQMGQDTPELLPLDEDDVEGVYFSGRVDKVFANGHALTIEAGSAQTERTMALTGIGRVQLDEVERPWYRINYNAPFMNIMYWRTERNTPIGQTSLTSGASLWEDSTNDHLELQFDFDLFDDRIGVVLGAAAHEQEVDTSDSNGFHTLMSASREEDQQALFGQFTIRFNPHFDLVLAGRYDESSLHDAQESPKAALVWKINENHSIRGTFNQAFQTPNYSEFFLRATANPIPFGAIEASVENVLGADLPLEWQTVPILALGNERLQVEEIETTEIGYKGIVGDRLYLTVDYYQSTLTNFVSDLLPGINPEIPPYQFPDGIPGAVEDVLLALMQQSFGPLVNGLSFNRDADLVPLGVPLGHPILTISYTNAGEVDMDGVEFSFNYYLSDRWVLEGNYSWFDFEVIDPGVENDIVPNAPENKWNLGLAYNGEKFSTGVRFKYTEEFPWATGIYAGVVPQYELVNLMADYRISDVVRATINVSNALDEEHFETYGGSVNGRRANLALNFRF